MIKKHKFNNKKQKKLFIENKKKIRVCLTTKRVERLFSIEKDKALGKFSIYDNEQEVVNNNLDLAIKVPVSGWHRFLMSTMASFYILWIIQIPVTEFAHKFLNFFHQIFVTAIECCSLNNFILFSSISLILATSPINGLLSLILIFIGVAIYLLTTHIEFLAYIYLIVYIGAIAILFLFVIMLFNLKLLTIERFYRKSKSFLKINFYIYLIFGIKFFMWSSLNLNKLLEKINVSDLNYYLFIQELGNAEILIFSDNFYTYYRYVFLLTGIILLVSMVGAIVLALSTTEFKKK